MQENYLSKINDEWIPLQIKVFSRWVASELKGYPSSNIHDVTKDLSNGVALVELAEILTHKNAPHLWNHKPTMKVENVQNCDLAIDMFTKDGVKIVGISGKDVSDNNQKLILGLIWSLILHYSIGNSMKFNSSLNEPKINNQPSNSQIKSNYNPQNELISWAIQQTNKYQNVINFEPFDLAICALLDSLCPDKIKFDRLKVNDHQHNAKLAFDVMNELGIKCFVYPEDLKNHEYKVDEMTLLIQLAAIKDAFNDNEMQQKGKEIAFSTPEELRIKKEEEMIRAKLIKEMEDKEEERQKELEEVKLKAEEAEKINAINQARLRIQEILHAKDQEEKIKNEEAKIKEEKENYAKAQEAKLKADEEARQKVEAEYRAKVNEEKRKLREEDESQDGPHHKSSNDKLQAKIEEAEEARKKAELRAKEAEHENRILERKLKEVEDEKAKLEKNQKVNDDAIDADEHDTHREKHVRIKIKVHHKNEDEEHKKYKIGIKVRDHHNENGHVHHHLVCKNVKVIRNGQVVPSEIEEEPAQSNGKKQSFHVKLL